MPFSKCDSLSDLSKRLEKVSENNNMKRLVHPVYYKELRERILKYSLDNSELEINTSFVDNYNNWVILNKRKVTYTDFIKIVLSTVDKIMEIGLKIKEKDSIEKANEFVKSCLFTESL